MAIDPRIAMGFQMPEQPSRLGMAANALQLKNMLMQGQMAEAEMAAKRSELERQTGIRNFLQTNDVNTPEGMAAFRKAYPIEAPKIETQMLEPQIKRAGMEKDQAQAKKYGTDAQAAEFKLKQDKVNQNLQLLANVQTPEQAAQWVSAGVTQGLISMEQAQAEISKIPRDPQGLAQWKQGQQAAGMTVSQQMEQMWKAKDFGLKSANELMTPDGQGGYRLNQPLLAAKQQVAKAGASNVNVTTKQETEEAKAVGKFLGEKYAEIQSAGIGAQGKLDRAARMEQLLNRINTGKFEGVKKDAAAIGQALGVKIDPNLGDAEAFEALSNQLALEARNPSGGAGMPGAMSDKDREFLQQITPNLSKTKEGNLTIIDTAKKLAQRDADVAKLARNYRQKRGTLDEGFFEELRQFSDANPLFNAAPAAPGIDDLVNKYRTPKNGNAR